MFQTLKKALVFIFTLSFSYSVHASDKSSALVPYKDSSVSVTDKDFAQTVLEYYKTEHGHFIPTEETYEEFLIRVQYLYAKNIYSQYDVFYEFQQRIIWNLYKSLENSDPEYLSLPDYSSDDTTKEISCENGDSNTSELCILSPSEEKTLSMVLSFFFSNEETAILNSTVLENPNTIHTSQFFNPKIIQKSGSTAMRFSKVLSIAAKVSKAYTPGIGLLEKSLLKFVIFPKDNEKYDSFKKEILEIIENEFDEKHSDTWTEDQWLHKDCAKQVLLDELRKREEDSATYKTIEGFVNLKLAGDALQLAGIFGNPLLKAGSAITGTAFKDIVPPLQIFLQMGKLYPQCGPALNELLKNLSSLYNGEKLKSRNELDALLLDAIRENKLSLLHKSASCGRVLAKIFTASLSMIYPGSGSFLSVALIETANAFTGLSLKAARSLSKKDEIFTLVSALQETYSDKALTEPSDNLKFYISQIETVPPLIDSLFMQHLQFSLAKKLVALDEGLFSYIILLRLRDENVDDEDSIHGFLRGLGISNEEMQKWTCLTKFFGPNFKFAKLLVQEGLLRN